MAQAMVQNKARARVHRIEDTHLHRLKDGKARDRLLETIFKEIDPDYGKSRMLTEDELARELGNIL